MRGRHLSINVKFAVITLVFYFGLTESACLQPNGGLEHWYTFDNGIGANNFRGSYGKLNTTTKISSIERGVVGNSLWLSNGTFEINVQDPVPHILGDFVVEMWTKVDVLRQPEHVLFSQYDESPVPIGYIVGLNDDGTMNIHLSNSASYTAVSNVSIADNKWHHIALVMYSDGRIPNLSVDGIENSLIGAQRINCCTPFPQSPFRLEDGRYDEVSLYRNALTNVDVLQLYEAGSDGKCSTSGIPNIGTKEYLESKGAECVPPANCSFNSSTTPVVIDDVVLDARNYTIIVQGNLTFLRSIVVVNEHTHIEVEQCPLFLDSTVRVLSNKTVVWFAAFPLNCFMDTNTVTLDADSECSALKKEPSKIGTFVHLGFHTTCRASVLSSYKLLTIILGIILVHLFLPEG